MLKMIPRLSKNVVGKRLFSSPVDIVGGPSVTLNTGAPMPMLAFGTWKTPPEVTTQSVETAIANGYRNIDCANDYNNEDKVGQGLTKVLSNYDQFGVRREDLFIQAKLWNTNHRKEHVLHDLQKTLDDLQLEYINSFVIHWPQASPSSGDYPTGREEGAFPAKYDKSNPTTRPSMFPIDKNGYFYSDNDCHYMETWEKMQELMELGLTKSIGVSNFNILQINEIINKSNQFGFKYQIPSILQNECHPYLQQKDLIDYCNIFGIQFQAFSSLGSGHTHLGVDTPPMNLSYINGKIPLENDKISKLSKKYNKSNAQIILKWNLQRGVSLVTKSTHATRIIENFKVFDWKLSDDDMKSFDKLNVSWRHLLWREASNHQDYPYKDCLPYGYQLEKAPLESSSGTTVEADAKPQ